MSKNGNRSTKTAVSKPKKNSMPWQQILFAGFALLIVISMILSAIM
jgi:hypothetical protein